MSDDADGFQSARGAVRWPIKNRTLGWAIITCALIGFVAGQVIQLSELFGSEVLRDWLGLAVVLLSLCILYLGAVISYGEAAIRTIGIAFLGVLAAILLRLAAAAVSFALSPLPADVPEGLKPWLVVLLAVALACGVLIFPLLARLISKEDNTE